MAQWQSPLTYWCAFNSSTSIRLTFFCSDLYFESSGTQREESGYQLFSNTCIKPKYPFFVLQNTKDDSLKK